MPDVQKLLNDYQIIFLSRDLVGRSCLGMSHFAFGRADYGFNDRPIYGRGHGGTAIFWSKNLTASSFSNCDGSIMGLKSVVKKIRVVFN